MGSGMKTGKKIRGLKWGEEEYRGKVKINEEEGKGKDKGRVQGRG
jgi:hypothetical protein